MPYVVLTGIGIVRQELMGHQHETGRAEAALEGARLYEGLLDRRQPARIQMLDRGYAFSVHAHREIKATRHRHVIDQNGAAAAQPLAAALARAEQSLLVQQLDQIAVRLDGEADCAAIQRKADRAGLAHSSPSMGRPSAARSARSRVSALIGSSVSRTPTASWIALAMA